MEKIGHDSKSEARNCRLVDCGRPTDLYAIPAHRGWDKKKQVSIASGLPKSPHGRMEYLKARKTLQGAVGGAKKMIMKPSNEKQLKKILNRSEDIFTVNELS